MGVCGSLVLQERRVGSRDCGRMMWVEVGSGVFVVRGGLLEDPWAWWVYYFQGCRLSRSSVYLG